MSRVTTKFGPVIGQKINPKGSTRTVDRYLGIPYAKPPVGPLRFRRPLPFDGKWSEPFEATKWPPMCPQFEGKFQLDSKKYKKTDVYSEDCLYLNIWVPEKSNNELKPVLVWIHGGGLVAGTSGSDLYDLEYIADKMDAVVVTFNYR